MKLKKIAELKINRALESAQAAVAEVIKLKEFVNSSPPEVGISIDYSNRVRWIMRELDAAKSDLCGAGDEL